jgi:hypothetical protein
MTDAELDKIILLAVKSGISTLGDLYQSVGIRRAASAQASCAWGSERSGIAASLQRLKLSGKIYHVAGKGWAICK